MSLPSPIAPATAGPRRVLPSRHGWSLWDTAASRQIEQAALAQAAPQALMARAGLGLARLALAIAPHARRVWVAAGPGNNGGDGLVLARWLHGQGLAVRVSLAADVQRLPPDASHALAQAQASGVIIHAGPAAPSWPGAGRSDLVVDALLGLGQRRAPDGALAALVRQLNQGTAPVLAVDVPTGLCGNTGRCLGDDPASAVRATATLALLTLKPGLFTAQGRDHAGELWLDALGIDPLDLAIHAPATAHLIGPEAVAALRPTRRHAQHKGSFGDVLVLAGAPGMGGAALLAARAALTAGAGRVFLARLDGDTTPDPMRPELMPRSLAAAMEPARLRATTVVCGCGGGTVVAGWMPAVLQHAARLVLDADGLNALAASPALQAALQARSLHGQPTVLTPHPLEAARLLGISASEVQASRLQHAQALADRWGCTVVLKGSGSVVSAPGVAPQINPTGNARLGTAGSGDVLAGWLGGWWAGAQDATGVSSACASVWWHGRAAEHGDLRQAMPAADLIEAMARPLSD